jgi:hypothetical protein
MNFKMQLRSAPCTIPKGHLFTHAASIFRLHRQTEIKSTLTLSLWKGRKTNRPRNKSAPVLREIVRAVFAAQVVLAADFTTEIRLPKELRSLTLTKSTLFSHLNPAKEACTPAFLLLTDRGGPKDAAQAAILLKKCVERCTRSRKEIYLST